ncbi:MAG: hypothetical protein KF744_05965 [Taibaiella sp.]|nr:hypothetical protein [Taibaiella sp.]
MDFWHYHGIFFLLGVTFFPRITTLFFSTVTFGPLAIIGWIFTPHLLVAVYATTYYWHSNPLLCVISWFVAIGGTGGEGAVARKRFRRKESY